MVAINHNEKVMYPSRATSAQSDSSPLSLKIILLRNTFYFEVLAIRRDRARIFFYIARACFESTTRNNSIRIPYDSSPQCLARVLFSRYHANLIENFINDPPMYVRTQPTMRYYEAAVLLIPDARRAYTTWTSARLGVVRPIPRDLNRRASSIEGSGSS